MRRRRLIVLVIAVLAVSGAGAFAFAASGRVRGSAEGTAEAYFAAWRGGDVPAMARMVYQAPSDFVMRHRSFSDDLHVESITLRPGTLKVTGKDTAEVPFTGVRELSQFGPWPFGSTLRLAVRDRVWKVIWTPETLHPLLKDGGTVRVTEFDKPATELVTSEGDKIPHDSYADAYLDRLRPEFDEVGEGWALESAAPGQQARRLMTVEPKAVTEPTTLSRPVQAAAARALDGVRDASIVAVRPSTGEVLAVADRLENASAFHDLFPPGSTFKTVTAAALLESGLDPSAEVDCPGTYAIPGHSSVRNSDSVGHGLVSFTDAYAYSCNTTFVEQAIGRLQRGGLFETAQKWGFSGVTLPTGVGGTCGRIDQPEDEDELALDAFGQGTVEATPLCMATVAAAVEDGSWRAPRILPAPVAGRIDGTLPEPVIELDQVTVAALRDMMAAVVDHGTAGEAGLPEGTHGKTGTAEVVDGEPHGWFIGYRDDLAFSVFVRNGGSGRGAALPIAARFLNGL